MKILQSENNFFIKEKTCIALGNFDGVHIGHQSIIKSAVDYALNNNASSCVYTFSEHPSYILGKQKPLLSTNDEKVNCFSTLGCDIAYFEDFSLVRNMTPADFCKKIIAEKLNALAVFCGENYRFGKFGSGDTTFLKNELYKLGIQLFIIPYTYYGDIIVSSSEIRAALFGSDLYKATKMLGRPYIISGIVRHGKKLGRKLGFPTLNIEVPDKKVVPPYGVYFSECEISGIKYKGISNIGIRPTIDNKNFSTVNCETYLFDYDGDAYGEQITVSILKALRSEKMFNSIEELKKQVEKDIQLAIEFFNIKNTEKK